MPAAGAWSTTTFSVSDLRYTSTPTAQSPDGVFAFDRYPCAMCETGCDACVRDATSGGERLDERPSNKVLAARSTSRPAPRLGSSRDVLLNEIYDCIREFFIFHFIFGFVCLPWFSCVSKSTVDFDLRFAWVHFRYEIYDSYDPR